MGNARPLDKRLLMGGTFFTLLPEGCQQLVEYIIREVHQLLLHGPDLDVDRDVGVVEPVAPADSLIGAEDFRIESLRRGSLSA
jgi:hypothetical protein